MGSDPSKGIKNVFSHVAVYPGLASSHVADTHTRARRPALSLALATKASSFVTHSARKSLKCELALTSPSPRSVGCRYVSAGWLAGLQMSSTLSTFAKSQMAADERESELKSTRRSLEERVAALESERVRSIMCRLCP